MEDLAIAISRVKNWVSAEVLYASDLNSEFNNILNNALSLVSPWTANMDAGGFRLITLGLGTVGSPTLQFTGDTNTGVYSPGADVVALTAGGVDVLRASAYTSAVNYMLVTPGQSGQPVVLSTAGTASGDQSTIRIATAFVCADATAYGRGTPTQHGLYRQNLPKAWARVSYTGGVPSLDASFNVTSISDDQTGLFTLTWTRAFESVDYVSVGMSTHGFYVGTATTYSSTAAQFQVKTDAGVIADTGALIIVLGNQ